MGWDMRQIMPTEQEGEYQVTWTCDYIELDHYEIRWGYRKEGEEEDYYESVQNQALTDGLQRSTYTPPTQYTLSHIFVDIKPVARQNDYWNGGYAWTQGYDRRWFGMADRQLPAVPDVPSISITNGNKLTVTINNIIQTGANSSRTNSIIFNIAKNGDSSYQTVEVPINNGTATYEMTVDYNAEYTVRAKGKNTVGESNYTNTWGGPERSAPIAITNFKIVPNVQDAGATVSLRMSWDENTYTDEYEIQYIDMLYDWSQEGSIQSINTVNTTYTLTIQNGGEYKFRLRGVNSAGNGAWTELNVSFGLAPNYPTIWSDVTSTTNEGTINLYWKHNPKDSTREYKAEISITSDVTGKINIPVQDRTNQDEKDWYKNGSYTLDLSQFKETTKLYWKVRTRGAKDEYSEWSPVKEITVYAKPYLTCWIQPMGDLGLIDEPERMIDEVVEYPFIFCSRITEGHKAFDSGKMLFKYGMVDGGTGEVYYPETGTNTIKMDNLVWETGYIDSDGEEQGDDLKHVRTYLMEKPTNSIKIGLPPSVVPSAGGEGSTITVSTTWTHGTFSMSPGATLIWDFPDTVIRAHSERLYLPAGTTIESLSGNYYIERIQVDENDVILTDNDSWNASSRTITASGYYYIMVANASDTNIPVDINSVDLQIVSPITNDHIPCLDICYYDSSKNFVSKETVTNTGSTHVSFIRNITNYGYYRLVYYYSGAAANVTNEDRLAVSVTYDMPEHHFVTILSDASLEDNADLQYISTILPSWAVGRAIWCDDWGLPIGKTGYALDDEGSWAITAGGTTQFILDIKTTGASGMTIAEEAAYLSNLKILRNYKHGFSQNITEYRILVTAEDEHEYKTAWDTVEKRRANEVIYENSFKPGESTIISGGIVSTVTPFTIDDILLVKGQEYKCTIEAYFESGLSKVASKTFTFNPTQVKTRVSCSGQFMDDYLTFNLRPNFSGDYSEYCLYVYRENPYDGSYTRIYGGYNYIPGAEIVDKHANFKMNNYVITVRSKTTASQASYHIQHTHHEPFPVIQWNERVDDSVPNRNGNLYKADQIRCIYNLDISESYKGTNEQTQYAGRILPTVTYGKQKTKSESWSFVIPEYDTETLTLIRTLSTLNEMVYIRTPDGDGYWAHVDVSINRTHMSVTTSVTLTIEKIWSDKP